MTVWAWAEAQLTMVNAVLANRADRIRPSSRRARRTDLTSTTLTC
jgi:hypothetical protein